MRNVAVALAAWICCGAVLCAAETAKKDAKAKPAENVYICKTEGFSMRVPMEKKDRSYKLVSFTLPPTNNFSPNVNVLKQAYPGTIKQYAALSAGQFKQMNWAVLKSEIKAGEIIFEYKGALRGRKLHWYARAVKKGAYVFLITATALESQWAGKKKVLTESVDSFKFDENSKQNKK